MSKIAIIYLSYHSEPYIDNVISGLKKIDYPKDKVVFVVVDQPHPEYGPSINAFKEKLLPISGKEIPEVVFLSQDKNLGFAGGNNVGIKWALENGFDYVFLHNQDGFLGDEILERLIEVIKMGNVGVAQPLVLLHPQNDLINTSGNKFHYLGFGYSGDYRKNKKSVQSDETQEIGYASGAAMLLRSDLLKKHGLLDEDYFLYHEDLEYSFRLRSLGYKVIIQPQATFFHQYQFKRNKDKYYLLERNRYAFILTYYKWPTLLLISPMCFIMELGLLGFALKNGWLKEKLRAYWYWTKLSNWKKWMTKRRKIQSERTVSDKELLSHAVGKISFDDVEIDNFVLKYIGNPLLRTYWWIVKKFIL